MDRFVTTIPKTCKKRSSCTTGKTSKTTSGNKKRSLSQTYIDAGQNDLIGRRICSKCNMVFTAGIDEHQHNSFCSKIGSASKLINANSFNTRESIVGDSVRIVEIESCDFYKIDQFLDAVKAELGCTLSLDSPSMTAYLHLQDAYVVGCLVVDQIMEERVIPLSETDDVTNVLSTKDGRHNIENIVSTNNENTAPTNSIHFTKSSNAPKQKKKEESRNNDFSQGGSSVLGVHLIWTHENHRRRRIATQLLHCACRYYSFGIVYPFDKIAFSQPTSMGRSFAQSYMSAKDIKVFC